ncbi:hypothetical protein FRB95_009884 [Tulasnella sp. JGI-2019a]|nr:hypothetical protein FRB95_009884 [Tulasnella sp. JGI-2019a]
MDFIEDGYDSETERLIAQMLMEDLAFIEDQAVAESFQVTQAIVTSQTASGVIPDANPIGSAAKWLDPETTFVTNAPHVKSTPSGSDAATIRDYQAALKLAAEERKSNLDYAYAKHLQAMLDADETDLDNIPDADELLSKDILEGILAQDLNRTGKERETGKGRATDTSSPSSPISRPLPLPKAASGILTCGICQEPFLQTKNPYKASQTPNSSSRIIFGQVFPCPGAHSYCIDCATSYIRGKLEGGGSDRIVFPIRCPECSPLVWQMDDETAASVLSPDLMDMWHHQRLLESLPKFWCPSARCSELIATDDEMEGVQASCPSCQTQICVACRSTWHTDLTCEEYQELPENERMPEDLAVLELARAENWRRCPSCHVIVELTQGCNHITCTCKFEFCFRCLSDWKGKCSSVPPCDLWDEEMLLNQSERERLRPPPRPPLPPAPALARPQAPAPAPPPPPPNPVAARAAEGGPVIRNWRDFLGPPLPPAPAPPLPNPIAARAAEGGPVMRNWHDLLRPQPRPVTIPPPPPPVVPPQLAPLPIHLFQGLGTGPIHHRNDERDTTELGWVRDPTQIKANHSFTGTMIRGLTCGYCNSRLNSLEDLRNHLANTTTHPVFACCGKFFKKDAHYDQHRGSGGCLRRNTVERGRKAPPNIGIAW